MKFDIYYKVYVIEWVLVQVHDSDEYCHVSATVPPMACGHKWCAHQEKTKITKITKIKSEIPNKIKTTTNGKRSLFDSFSG